MQCFNLGVCFWSLFNKNHPLKWKSETIWPQFYKKSTSPHPPKLALLQTKSLLLDIWLATWPLVQTFPRSPNKTVHLFSKLIFHIFTFHYLSSVKRWGFGSRSLFYHLVYQIIVVFQVKACEMPGNRILNTVSKSKQMPSPFFSGLVCLTNESVRHLSLCSK